MTIFKRLGAFASIGLLAVASHSVSAAEGCGKLRVIQNAMAGDAVTTFGRTDAAKMSLTVPRPG